MQLDKYGYKCFLLRCSSQKLMHELEENCEFVATKIRGGGKSQTLYYVFQCTYIQQKTPRATTMNTNRQLYLSSGRKK